MRLTARWASAALMVLAADSAMAQGTSLQTQGAVPAPTTTRPSVLQGYALTLQEQEEKLKAARDEAARGPAQSQEGAMSEQRIDLMQTLRGALRTVQIAPEELASTQVYKDAERHLRRRFDEVGASRRLDKEEGVAAADSAG